MMSRVYGVSEVGEQVRRNRECTNCGYRFITMEKVIGPVRKYCWQGAKKDGEPE